MEERLGLHGLWFGGGVVASIVSGSAMPLVDRCRTDNQEEEKQT